MPTMPETSPLPTAFGDELANRVTAVQPESECYGSESSSLPIEPPFCRYSDKRLSLTVRPTTERDIAWAVELLSSRNPAETYPWGIQNRTDQIPSEQRLTDESEWEWYEELLWDPKRAEVRLMVQEFYEQNASASSDHATQRNNGDAIPLNLQADSGSSTENLDFTQTGDEFQSETRLVPPPTPEYRVRVKFRFTGEDTPRIHTDPDLI